jgi:hypothetical protein
MAKKTSLSAALTEAAAAGAPPRPARGRAGTRGEERAVRARTGAKTYREGMVNVTGYFPPAVNQSLRLIQAKHPEKTVEDLLAEALDDLFARYNVPQSARVRH